MFTRDALEYLRTVLHRDFTATVVAGTDATVLPLPKDLVLHDLERFQAHPNAVRAAVQLLNVDSFCDYVNRFATEVSTIYLDTASGKFAAVIDHHDREPAWCQHRAIFEPRLSAEWVAWRTIHGNKLSQIEFAHFVEAQLDTISYPEPAEILKAALDFQSNESLVLGSAMNLDDGSTRFNFVKDNVARSVKFPHRIGLFVPIYSNENPQDIELRIRYRSSSDGALSFFITFVQNPVVIEEKGLNTLATLVRHKCEKVSHLYNGVPPASK